MSEFGDIEPEDSYVEGNVPDAEQVARRLHELRQERGLETEDWDALVRERRALLILIVGALLAWLNREGTWAPGT
jgi:hypothetical protein